jgi:hypothetical protein
MDRQMNAARISITALSVSDLAKLLKRTGSRYASECAIQKDIDSGAPENPDGTINLINYAAWLAGRLSCTSRNCDAISVPANAGINVERMGEEDGP